MSGAILETEILFVLGVLFLLGMCSWKVLRTLRRVRLLRTSEKISLRIEDFLSANFTVQPCFRCYEAQWEFLRVSARARSLECRCSCCGKRQWAPAATSQADQVLELLQDLEAIRRSYQRLTKEPLETTKLLVEGPDAPLPFEQMTRSQIPESCSAAVWRRDGGICVNCGAQHNLQFDHIIPLSRGGATSIKNLQLLCQSCNLSKGVRI